MEKRQVDYLKIANELGDADMESLIEEAIDLGLIVQCFRCQTWAYKEAPGKNLIGEDESEFFCEHCI